MSTITYYKNTSTNILDAATSVSTINVFGQFGSVTNVSVVLSGLSHTFPDDLDVLLLAPNNLNNLLFMSDAGNTLDLNDVNLAFSDTATACSPTRHRSCLVPTNPQTTL